MNRREGLLLVMMLLIIGGSVLAGSLADRSGDTYAEPVYAAENTPTPTATPTPTPKLVFITANYLKGSELLGTRISRKDIKVVANYDDGESEEVSDYSMSSDLINVDGDNVIVIGYKSQIAYLSVRGKTLKSVYASCSRFSYTVGNGPDNRDITLAAFYSDGSMEEIKEGYTIAPSVLTTVGMQKVTISYKGCSDTLELYATEPRTVKAVTVTCEGNISQGEQISKNKLTVIAVYADLMQERITNYNILTPIFKETGKHDLRVSYQGVEGKIEISVIPKTMVSIKAEYKGPNVMVGSEYDENDMYVTATYSDGSTERITDYRVANRKVKYLGENTFKIIYGDFNFLVDVIGIAAKEPDFTYVSSCRVVSRTRTATVVTALPPALEEDAITCKKLTTTKLKKVYRKLGSSSDDYMGFSYNFANDDHEVYLPVTVRIQLPAGFEAEFTDLYFSRNLKTVVGCLNKKVIDKSTIEVTINKTGYYMLICDPAAYAEEEPEEEIDD